jgi:hypothetical protein
MDGRHARELLGVSDDADHDEIQRAFRALAQRTHPDHGGDRTAFEATVGAYESLRRTPARTTTTPGPVITLAPARPRVDVYDSVRRQPRRSFDDALRAACASAGV